MTHDVDLVLAFKPGDAEAIEAQFPLEQFYARRQTSSRSRRGGITAAAST